MPRACRRLRIRAPKGVIRTASCWAAIVCAPIAPPSGAFYYRVVSSRQYSGALLILLAAFLAAGASVAQPLAFGFRPAPPYVLQQADGGLSGLEYELVLAAAQAGGLELKPEIAPLGRLVEDFRRGRSQGIVPANAEMALPGCLTDTLLVYRNIAFSLRQRGLKPATFADLAGYDVVAFQNARRM